MPETLSILDVNLFGFTVHDIVLLFRVHIKYLFAIMYIHALMLNDILLLYTK